MDCPYCNLPLFVSRLGVYWCPQHGVIAEQRIVTSTQGAE